MLHKESENYAKKLLFKYKIREVLDLGAGKNPHHDLRANLGIKQFLVDLIPNPRVLSDEIWIQASVLDEKSISQELSKVHCIESGKIDCVVALHCIEHLNRDEGAKLLVMMEKLSRKLTIIETPNGYVHQSPTKDNPWQEHLSGWTARDFRQRGYKVRGVSGMKFLKKSSNKGAYKWHFPGIRHLDIFLSRALNLNYFASLSFNLVAWKTHSVD